jgi:YD repeat-containing protein
VFNPAFDSVRPTHTVYDVFDRTLSVVHPAGETTKFAYGFGPDRANALQFLTRVTDANAIPRETYRDVKDAITAVKLFNNGGTSVLWTSYAYDPLDQITTVTDDKGDVTRSEYDNFGRRTAIVSPDAGRTDYVFDTAGNLYQKITANLKMAGQAVAYNYDYNRIATRVYPQYPGNNVAYTYGGPGAAGERDLPGRADQLRLWSSGRGDDRSPSAHELHRRGVVELHHDV